MSINFFISYLLYVGESVIVTCYAFIIYGTTKDVNVQMDKKYLSVFSKHVILIISNLLIYLFTERSKYENSNHFET